MKDGPDLASVWSYGGEETKYRTKSENVYKIRQRSSVVCTNGAGSG